MPRSAARTVRRSHPCATPAPSSLFLEPTLSSLALTPVAVVLCPTPSGDQLRMDSGQEHDGKCKTQCLCDLELAQHRRPTVVPSNHTTSQPPALPCALPASIRQRRPPPSQARMPKHPALPLEVTPQPSRPPLPSQKMVFLRGTCRRCYCWEELLSFWKSTASPLLSSTLPPPVAKPPALQKL